MRGGRCVSLPYSQQRLHVLPLADLVRADSERRTCEFGSGHPNRLHDHGVESLSALNAHSGFR